MTAIDTLRATLVVVGLALATAAGAQTPPATGAPATRAQPSLTLPAPAPDVPAAVTNPADAQQPAPAALVAPPVPPAPQPTGKLHLSAVLAGDSRPLRSGVTWRVFSQAADPDGDAAAPVARSDDPDPTFSLKQGAYVVHAAYGYASAMRHVTIGNDATERLTISAGALKISGAINEMAIPPAKLVFSVYVPIGQNPEGRLVVGNARPGEIVRLPEGTYHVVSTYGDSNAIMRADLKVETGKITEATLNHRAATVTLKLVRKEGGEAFAGTAFSVLTPGGDVIREAIGAFPSFILAEGDYVVIARHEGQVYTREFKVQSGLDRDIDVIAK